MGMDLGLGMGLDKDMDTGMDTGMDRGPFRGDAGLQAALWWLVEQGARGRRFEAAVMRIGEIRARMQGEEV